MNLTNEQIDALIAALEAQRQAAQKPLEWWVVLDCDGDIRRRMESPDDAAEELAYANRGGSYGPYTLHHMREVLP